MNWFNEPIMLYGARSNSRFTALIGLVAALLAHTGMVFVCMATGAGCGFVYVAFSNHSLPPKLLHGL